MARTEVRRGIRTRVRWGRVAGLATALVLAGSAVAQSTQGASAGESGARAERVVTHLVRPGDTLWELARDAVGPQGDPRPVVERIREANGLRGSSLVVGERIVLPPA